MSRANASSCHFAFPLQRIDTQFFNRQFSSKPNLEEAATMPVPSDMLPNSPSPADQVATSFAPEKGIQICAMSLP
jgi:hypothetical protein